MVPPEKPLPDACCGTGCTVCVYDVYLQELERYLAEQAQRSGRPVAASLDPSDLADPGRAPEATTA